MPPLATGGLAGGMMGPVELWIVVGVVVGVVVVAILGHVAAAWFDVNGRSRAALLGGSHADSLHYCSTQAP